ncbi:hypothetical protein [Riemerella anatipestifer]|uniref:hypothetical protein n=1 Tax=Riemerella anatipestifer TaxID=34085 RepID=UPI00129E2B67|nr:hypothetical protein [Riemerella anatipestifer]MRM84336.1 hypothetical protein [Riemerella anatipestifer]
MKKTIYLLGLLLVFTSCTEKNQKKVVTNETIITLSKTKGMSDDIICEIISENPTQFKVDEVEDIIYLKENNVSDKVINQMKYYKQFENPIMRILSQIMKGVFLDSFIFSNIHCSNLHLFFVIRKNNLLN